jgi:GxxExxY protein
MKEYEPISPDLERLASTAIDAAYKVHRALGPGLLESVYEACYCHELRLRGVEVETQVDVPITYEGLVVLAGLRLDMLVGKQLIIELKAVETMIPVFDAQLLSYLRPTNHRLGLLINFNVPVIKDGIKRIIL